ICVHWGFNNKGIDVAMVAAVAVFFDCIKYLNFQSIYSMTSSSSSSSLKRSIDHVDMPNDNISPNKKINFTPTMFQSKIINMFKDANLTIPINLLGK
ncbi:unnamed protein product, partial [Rotaria magnacalcarata]